MLLYRYEIGVERLLVGPPDVFERCRAKPEHRSSADRCGAGAAVHHRRPPRSRAWLPWLENVGSSGLQGLGGAAGAGGGAGAAAEQAQDEANREQSRAFRGLYTRPAWCRRSQRTRFEERRASRPRVRRVEEELTVGGSDAVTGACITGEVPDGTLDRLLP